MKRALFGAVGAAALLCGATGASACRERVPRPGELAAYPSPIVVTVKTAQRIEQPGWNTWRVVADGPAGSPVFEFTTTLSSSGCGRTPLPPAGAQWVVYLERVGSTRVIDAFPLDFAREYDARLADVPVDPTPHN